MYFVQLGQFSDHLQTKCFLNWLTELTCLWSPANLSSFHTSHYFPNQIMSLNGKRKGNKLLTSVIQIFFNGFNSVVFVIIRKLIIKNL